MSDNEEKEKTQTWFEKTRDDKPEREHLYFWNEKIKELNFEQKKKEVLLIAESRQDLTFIAEAKITWPEKDKEKILRIAESSGSINGLSKFNFSWTNEDKRRIINIIVNKESIKKLEDSVIKGELIELSKFDLDDFELTEGDKEKIVQIAEKIQSVEALKGFKWANNYKERIIQILEKKSESKKTITDLELSALSDFDFNWTEEDKKKIIKISGKRTGISGLSKFNWINEYKEEVIQMAENKGDIRFFV